MATISIEKRQRGFFGWIVLILFGLFNSFMCLMLLVMAFVAKDAAHGAYSDEAAALSIGMLLFFWGAGAAVLGLFAYLTRGRKVIISDVI